MSEYKGIAGTKIQNFSSDPSDPLEGQIWYNSTSSTLKGLVLGTASWATGGNLNQGRHSSGGGGTSKDAALVFGGRGEPPNPKTANTELYNGTSWTEVNNLGTARYGLSGAGDQTAGLAFGGDLTPGTTTASESWNGTSWSGTASMNTGARFGGSCGTQTSALSAGRANPPNTAIVESWNGSTWSEVADLNSGRSYGCGLGADNSNALLVGGGSASALVESWNGSAWTEITDLNLGRDQLCGAGIQTLGVVFGGTNPAASPNPTANTEEWNGSTWTETANMATARGRGAVGPMGTAQSAMMAGGTPVNGNPATEEFTGGGLTIKTFTTS